MSSDSDTDPLSTGGAFGVLSGVAGQGEDRLVGRELGDYRITGLIAEGGMGRVYRADRTDGSFEREVAIKVCASGAISQELQSRFIREQSVLASLNHPNICQLYDARISDDGLPYFVMEYVDGSSIVDYCAGNGLDAEKRIELLIDIVDAVAYAHSKLVVHRDIKPANVLVNANGQAKLLDFGIAKLLESDRALTQATPLTPRYASPEQLLGQPITVASDIVQLGLLLHEVLTGAPLNPSETLADAIQRAADGRSLRVQLEDADAIPREVLPIIEQCLRADPADRYADANSLKADLKAYLGGYPVAAVGQSTAYRLKKFVARNKPTAITAMVAFTAITVGVSWYTWQLAIARAAAEEQAAAARLEADRANQVSQFLVDLFDAPDPQYARGADVTVRQVLESGIDKVRNELDGQERLQADLLMTLGRVFDALGEFDQSGPLLEEAVATHRAIAGDDTIPLAIALYTQAQQVSSTGELEEAARIFEEALQTARMTPGQESLELQPNILNSLGIILSRLNRFEESATVYEQAIAIRTQLYGADQLETSVPIANYARLLTKLGRYEEALPMLESAYRIAVDELGPYHPWIAPRAINLGRTYQQLGRMAEAGELLGVALDQDRHIYGDKHHYVASSLQNLGILVYEEKDRREGMQLLEQALAIEENSLGDAHIDTNQTRYLLAGFYTDAGRYDEAGPLLDQARSNLKEAFENDHIYLAEVAKFRGKYLLATGQPGLAAMELTESLEMFERLFDSNSERLPEVLLLLAQALSATGDSGAAVETYSRGLKLLEAAGQATDEQRRRFDELQKAASAT